jgi:hypothetical protein
VDAPVGFAHVEVRCLAELVGMMSKLLRLPGDIEILSGNLQTQPGRSNAEIAARNRRREANQYVPAGLNGRIGRSLCGFLSALGLPE